MGAIRISIYKTRKWQRKREAVLRRDGYLCQECKRYGRRTPATTVHHIVPLEENKKLAYMNKNLLSLCNKCHEGMHNREGGVLTDVGEQWRQRIAPLLKT